MINIPLLGITMGDYNGIGPEVTLKAIAHNLQFLNATYLIIGSASIIEQVNQHLNMPIKPIVINELSKIKKINSAIYVLDIFNNKKINIKYGEITQESGFAALQSLYKGIDLAKKNFIQALITAPVSKKALHLVGVKFAGQTEMLATLTNTSLFAMLLISGSFRVGLVTTHCAISEISYKIKKEVIYQKIDIINKSLIKDFKIKEPRIAVASLNPHGGERGLFGNEEQQQILPAIIAAKHGGINVSGPFPADTLFAKIKESNYDAYLAMYHDQGLIPLKMIAFGRGVNFTAGLPIIRTSPDHGTAFDIAGKYIANESSMIEAIKIGYELANKRTTG